MTDATNLTLAADQAANRSEVRGLTEDFTDLQGNVYRLDLLSLFKAMDERYGQDGAVERAEMRTALAAASDDQGNVRREALDREWAKATSTASRTPSA